MLRRLVRLILALTFAGTLWAQDDEATKSEREKDKIAFDLSFSYDPEELRENIVDRLRFKRIWGPFGIAGYHIFPSKESGPYDGPPLSIWTNGWATSLWRDPVTGWPTQ